MALNIHHILHLSSEVFLFFSIFVEPFEFNQHRIYLRQKPNIHHFSKNANQLLNFFAFFLFFCAYSIIIIYTDIYNIMLQFSFSGYIWFHSLTDINGIVIEKSPTLPKRRSRTYIIYIEIIYSQ